MGYLLRKEIMNQKTNWDHWLTLMFKDFMTETDPKSGYEILHIYECKKTGFTKATIKIPPRGTIIEKNIRDIVIENEFLENLDKKTIRTLTHIATMEYLNPDYFIVSQKMTVEADNCILEIKSNSDYKTIKKSPTEISKDKTLVARFNSIEANRIGYMAGVLETVMEYDALKQGI